MVCSRIRNEETADVIMEEDMLTVPAVSRISNIHC